MIYEVEQINSLLIISEKAEVCFVKINASILKKSKKNQKKADLEIKIPSDIDKKEQS